MNRTLAVWTLILGIVGGLIFITMTTMFAGLNERQQEIARSALWASFQADREAAAGSLRP